MLPLGVPDASRRVMESIQHTPNDRYAANWWPAASRRVMEFIEHTPNDRYAATWWPAASRRVMECIQHTPSGRYQMTDMLPLGGPAASRVVMVCESTMEMADAVASWPESLHSQV